MNSSLMSDGRRLVFILAGCTCVAFALTRMNFPNSVEMAAWFQGVGTVAAVFATVALQFRNENNALQIERYRRLSMLQGASTLAVAARQTAIEAVEILHSNDRAVVEGHLAGMNDLIAQFARWAEVPILQWPVPSLAVALDSLGRSLVDVSETLVELANTPLSKEARSGNYQRGLAGLEARFIRFNQLAEIANKRLS